MTDAEIKQIELRLADADSRDDPSMHSACWEYQCDCHRDMPHVLRAAKDARAELQLLKNTLGRLAN